VGLLGVVTLAVYVAGCGGPIAATNHVDHSSGGTSRAGIAVTALANPHTYAQTCALEPQDCHSAPPGTAPATVWRPLRLQADPSRQSCPVTRGHYVKTGGFSGVALGDSSVRPLIAEAGREKIERGTIVFRPPAMGGWRQVKTLWFAAPAYTGPVILRGQRTDRAGKLAFGDEPNVGSLVLPPLGYEVNNTYGYRGWPGATWVRAPGCYAWQVDTLAYSKIIVFKAIFSARS